MDKTGIRRIEIDLLLTAIYERYGHDFRKYSRSHVERRIDDFVAREKFNTVTHLTAGILHDESIFRKLVLDLSITVSEMFRDPPVFRSLRENVVPRLRGRPFVKAWVAGCATGEEAYSLAILLEEERLYERSTIYATDFNDAAIERAKEGIYSIDRTRRFTVNYQQAGGKSSFAEYYHAHYGSVTMDPSLKRNLVFANHNLALDEVFTEAHLVLCRNVLIYFSEKLQHRVLGLFADSLVQGGFLCLGSSEDLRFTGIRDSFEVVDEAARIYRKTSSKPDEEISQEPQT